MYNLLKQLILQLFLFISLVATVFAQNSGLSISDWHAEELPDHTIRLSVILPENAHASADAFGPQGITPLSSPQTQLLFSELMGKSEPTYTAGTCVWILPAQTARFVHVAWQVCIGEMCYMPDEGDVPVSRPGGTDMAVSPNAVISNSGLPAIVLPPYKLLRSADGYLSAKQFSDFLRGTSANSSASLFEGRGFFAMLLLAIFGGVALNLTPCVLPLLPVNLAMIGAGAGSMESRSSKIRRGIAYGIGIAVTYGALGVFSVLLGTTFGGIDSHWLFNAVIALVFLLLALAMFEVFSIDFSRIGEKLPMPENSRMIGIALMGALSAIVAGACVAPVLVAALLQAAKMVAHGNYSGLLLPFALGIGMALPWPIAAAGISFLPAPGRWMVRVKQGLGVLILCLAGYYAYLSIDLYRHAPKMNPADEGKNVQSAGMVSEISNAFAQAQSSGCDVLLDFTAAWCKNCKAMELTVFPDSEVAPLMKSFHVLQLHADSPSAPETAAVLREFQVKGLPAFRIVRPLVSESAESKAALR